MAIKVGINGFGRIGRNVMRASLNDPNIDFVAVNDLTSPKTLAHLLKYDSILGNLHNQISAGADSITVDNKTFKVFAEKDPAKLPWESVGAQIVLESTGHFTDANDAKKHLRGPVKKVIISAPAKNEDVTLRARRQRTGLRCGQASHHFERLVHYELSGTHRESRQ